MQEAPYSPSAFVFEGRIRWSGDSWQLVTDAGLIVDDDLDYAIRDTLGPTRIASGSPSSGCPSGARRGQNPPERDERAPG